jgi:hypothetical protein
MNSGSRARSPNMKHTSTESIRNAANMSYMTNLKEIRCDYENFGARINGFGVLVGSIWLKEILG